MSLHDDYNWMGDAGCRGLDPELFFPPQGAHRKPAVAVVCRGCPVQAECLAYAVEIGARHGIFGGLSALQRRPLMKGRKWNPRWDAP